LPLALKLCADPISMNFVFFACDWSLFTVNQSITLTKSEFNLSIRSSVSCEEVNICVSSAYKHGTVDSRQFDDIN
jgi:hypothetical protein